MNEAVSMIAGTLLLIVLVVSAFVLAWYVWRWKNSRWFSGLCVVGALCIIWGTVVEPYRLVVREFPIENQNLPTMRIGVLGDFHLRLGKSENFVNRVVKKVNDQDVDLVVITGDFFTGSIEKYQTDFLSLQNLQVPVYFIFGNHDYVFNRRLRTGVYDFYDFLETLGLSGLKNESIEVRNNRKDFYLLGIEDNYLGFDNLLATFDKTPTDAPKILLAHSPDIIDQFDAGDTRQKNTQGLFAPPIHDRKLLPIEQYPDLIISGHTHCGQIRFPVVGSLDFMIPTHNGTRFDRHWYPEQNLFVTCGLGESLFPSRFLNPPEIVVLKVN